MATTSDEETGTGTHIEQVQGVLAKFSRVEAGLAALREKHGNVVYPVATTAGMEDAKAARAEIRAGRFAVEKLRKNAKTPLLQIGRRIDQEAIRITEAILEVEQPIDDQIKAEEARKAAEKEAKRAAEVERLRLEAAEKLRIEQEQLAAQRAEIAAEQARLAEERLAAERETAAERARINEELDKARHEAKAAREKADADAAEARREADLELAAQRRALEEERAEIEAHERIVADAQAAEAKRLVDAQEEIDAQQRSIEAERQKAREEAERNAAEERAAFQGVVSSKAAIFSDGLLTSISEGVPSVAGVAFGEAELAWQEPPAGAVSGVDVPAVSSATDDPMAVWDELKAVWESLDIEDGDAVEEWANCVLNEGEHQAKRLTDALADRVA